MMVERHFPGHKAKLGLAAAGLLIIGGAAGAGAITITRPPVEMAPMAPVPIARLAQTSGPITLRGRVVEVYGNKFVLDDGSSKTLVDSGPRGDGGALVALGATTTVQGRYDRGFVHASFLVDANGNVTELGPVGGPPHPGPHGPPPPPPPGGPDRAPPPNGVAPPPVAGADRAAPAVAAGTAPAAR